MSEKELLHEEQANGDLIEGCRFGEAGIFVGLVSWSSRLGLNVHDVYHRQILPLFERYRSSLKINGTDLPELYYQPIPFSLFGRWDFGVISLVDDTEFVRQTFRPFDPMVLGDTQLLGSEVPHRHRPFQHKVIFGPVPIGEDLNENKPNGAHEVEDLFRNMFACQEQSPRPPLVAICQLKLNPYLTCGSGLGMMRAAILGLKIICGRARRESGVRSLILQSYAWNELTLILLGRAYQDLHNLVLQAREWSVGSLSELIRKEHPHQADRFQSYFNSPTVAQLLFRLKQTAGTTGDPLQGTHVFINTTTMVGFSHDIESSLLNLQDPPVSGRGQPENQEIGAGSPAAASPPCAADARGENASRRMVCLQDIDPVDKVSVIQHWSVRPGHLAAAMGRIQALPRTDSEHTSAHPGAGKDPAPQTGGDTEKLQYISFGTSDLLVQYRENIPTRRAIEQFVKWFRESSGDIVSSNTIIALPGDQAQLPPASQPPHGPGISQFLVKLVLSPEEIRGLSKGLSAIGYPKIESTRVLNLLSNCNDCMADPLCPSGEGA